MKGIGREDISIRCDSVQPGHFTLRHATDMPKVPAPDEAAAWVPQGYKAEVFLKDHIFLAEFGSGSHQVSTNSV